MKTYDHPDAYFDDGLPFLPAMRALRPLVLATGLEECIKWGQPCYTDAGRNVCIIGYRKAGAVLSFFSGALLDDPQGLLHQPGRSRAGRYLLFAGPQEVAKHKSAIDRMVREATENVRAGRKVPRSAADEIEWVAELQQVLDSDPEFRAAFLALTPGRQRGYNIHIGKAKRASTRRSRIDRHRKRIFMGKGIFDCVCGHSKRPPRCDGSHKQYPGSR